MDDNLYESYVGFLLDGTLPETFVSTKSNFKREAKKYHVANRVLFRSSKKGRQHKQVLKSSELENIWTQFHVHGLHSGTFK